MAPINRQIGIILPNLILCKNQKLEKGVDQIFQNFIEKMYWTNVEQSLLTSSSYSSIDFWHNCNFCDQAFLIFERIFEFCTYILNAAISISATTFLQNVAFYSRIVTPLSCNEMEDSEVFTTVWRNKRFVWLCEGDNGGSCIKAHSGSTK